MSNIHLKVENVSLRFRIYGVGSQSLKKEVISFGTGGRLGRDTSNHISVQAISNISFDLSEGDRLGIIGSNGAGKSTLLRILAGIYQPQEGYVASSGRITAIIDPSVALDPFATGYENIQARAVLLEIPVRELSIFTDRVKEISELGDYLDMPVHTYSSGMLMRLNFALSISISPDILLLDEWLSVTDHSFTEKAEVYMKNLVKNSKILVLASHNLELLKRVCNLGIYLEEGQAKHIGPIDDVISYYQ